MHDTDALPWKIEWYSTWCFVLWFFHSQDTVPDCLHYSTCLGGDPCWSIFCSLSSISYYLLWLFYSMILLTEVHWFQQKLHISRLFDPMEIEGLQLAVGSALDVLFVMLTKLSKVKNKATGSLSWMVAISRNGFISNNDYRNSGNWINA